MEPCAWGRGDGAISYDFLVLKGFAAFFDRLIEHVEQLFALSKHRTGRGAAECDQNHPFVRFTKDAHSGVLAGGGRPHFVLRGGLGSLRRSNVG